MAPDGQASEGWEWLAVIGMRHEMLTESALGDLALCCCPSLTNIVLREKATLLGWVDTYTHTAQRRHVHRQRRCCGATRPSPVVQNRPEAIAGLCASPVMHAALTLL
jgi:hypothetical protein